MVDQDGSSPDPYRGEPALVAGDADDIGDHESTCVDGAAADDRMGVAGILLIVSTAFSWLGTLYCVLMYFASSGPNAIEGTMAFSAALVGWMALTVTLVLSSATALYLFVRSRRAWLAVLAAVCAVSAAALWWAWSSLLP